MIALYGLVSGGWVIYVVVQLTTILQNLNDMNFINMFLFLVLSAVVGYLMVRPFDRGKPKSGTQEVSEKSWQYGDIHSSEVRLSITVAQEIRNPLTSIKGFTQLLNEREENRSYTNVMLSDIEQIEGFIDDLLLAMTQEEQGVQPRERRNH